MNTEKLVNDLAKDICAYLEELATSDSKAFEEITRVLSFGVPLAMLVATQATAYYRCFFKVTRGTLLELCECRIELVKGWKYDYPRRWTNEVVKFENSCVCGECEDK